MQVDPMITSPSQPLYPQIPPQLLSDPAALTQFIQSLPAEQIQAIRTRILNPTPQDDAEVASRAVAIKEKLDSMPPGQFEAMRTQMRQHMQQQTPTQTQTNGIADNANTLSAEQTEALTAQIVYSSPQSNGVPLASDQANVMLEKLKSLPPNQIQALRTRILNSSPQSSSSVTAPLLPFISLPKKQTDLSQFVHISPPRSKLNGVDKAMPTAPENKALSQPNRPLSAWLGDFLNPRTKIDAMSNMREIVKDLGEEKTAEQQVADRIFFVDAVTSGANAEFHRSILSSKSAMRLLKTWLLNSLKAKDAFATKIMKLLDILPWQVEDIKTIKELELGKLIRIAGKDESAKEISVRLQRRIRRLVEQESKADEKQEDGPRKKVKLDNGTSAAGPSIVTLATSASVSASAASKPAAAPLKVTVKPKGPVRTTLSALDNATSKPSTYNSFFDQIGASKAKPPPKKAAVAPVAQVKAAVPPPPPPAKSGSVLDSVIDSMTASKKEKTPEVAPSKKRKRVTFKPDDDLVQIRYIDLVDRDGNPRTSHQTTGEARDLDVREGHHVRSLMGHTDALGALIEEVEWSIPAAVDLPPEVARESIERGHGSTEKVTQEEREQHVVGAVYIFAAQIPDSPSEPKNIADANPYGEEGDPKMIVLPQQLQQQQQQQAPQPTVADFVPLTNSLESLLRSLQPPPQQPPPMPDLNSLLGLPQANAPAVDFNAIMGMLSNVQQQPMQAPMSMSMPMQSQMPAQPQPQMHTQTQKWNPNWTPRVTCKYWLEGKCRKGDQCTFKHTQ